MECELDSRPTELSLLSVADELYYVSTELIGYLTQEDRALLAVAVVQRQNKRQSMTKNLLDGVNCFCTERLPMSTQRNLSDEDVSWVLLMNKNLGRLSLSGCTSITGKCLASLGTDHSRLRYINLRNYAIKGDEPTEPEPKLNWRNIKEYLSKFINSSHDGSGLKIIMPSEINIMASKNVMCKDFVTFIVNTKWPLAGKCSSCDWGNCLSCSPFALASDEYHAWNPKARTNQLFTQQTVCSVCLKAFCNDPPRWHTIRGLTEPFPVTGNCYTYFCDHCLEVFCSECCAWDSLKTTVFVCNKCKIYGTVDGGVDNASLECSYSDDEKSRSGNGRAVSYVGENEQSNNVGYSDSSDDDKSLFGNGLSEDDCVENDL